MASQKSNKGQNTAYRTRNYATVVYPESAPADWMEILSMKFIPAFISPLHDKDINPTGEPKKAHYHVVLMFDSVKTKEQAQEIFSLIGGVGCEVVSSIRGYARYLCHLDNPEKAQYSTEDVRCLSGSDYISIIGLVTDKYKALCEIMDFCDEYNIYSYYDLVTYCRKKRMDWFRVLADNGTYMIERALKSKRWTNSGRLDSSQVASDSDTP